MKRSFQLQNLAVRFTDELERTTNGLSNEEKTDVINALLEIIFLYERKADYSEIWKVTEEKLILKYKNKLKAFSDTQVLDYLNQRSLKLAELQDELEITDAQFISEEEYPGYLADLKRMLQSRKQIAMIAEPSQQLEQQLVSIEERQSKNPEHTARRQTLAMHYLSQYCGFNKGSDIALARFVQFLTGKNLDNITKILRNPLKVSPEKRKRADEELVKDLIYIRDHFDALRLPQIVALINRDISAVMKE